MANKFLSTSKLDIADVNGLSDILDSTLTTPFAGVLKITNGSDSTLPTNGSIQTAGGLGVEKDIQCGGDIYGDHGSAWSYYEDDGTSYPLVINSGGTSTLPNNALSGITNISQLPSNGYNFYDPLTNRFVPEFVGDSYTLGIRITASSSSATGSGDLTLNINSGAIIIDLGVINFQKGIGVITNFDKTASVFTLATFVSNGAVVQYKSLVGNTTITSIAYHIVRTHRAR